MIENHYFGLQLGETYLTPTSTNEKEDILNIVQGVKSNEIAEYYRSKSKKVREFYAGMMHFKQFPKSKEEHNQYLEGMAITKYYNEVYSGKGAKKKGSLKPLFLFDNA